VPELAAWLAGQNLDLVAVDAPDLPALFPTGWVQSGPRVYVRLHSRNAGNWYGSDKERYDYSYSDAELGEWVRELRHHATAGDTEEALVLFNNCHRSQAAVNARRLRQLLEQQAPELEVVTPFTGAGPEQRTLFG
jgi:uncharacterized protein YecE (DUF72 family)